MKKLFGKKKDPMEKAYEVALTSSVPSESDPFGMYTGVPKDPKEKPIQDADDL